MNSPYTDHPSEAFQAAEIALAAVSTFVLTRADGRRLRAATVLVLAVVWGAALLPVAPLFWSAFVERRDDAALLRSSLTALELALGAAALLSRRPLRAALGVAVAVFAGAASRWVTDSNWEVCSLHMIAAWAVWAIGQDPARVDADRTHTSGPGGTWMEDAVVFAIATAAGAAMSTWVLERGIDSSDEWGYTYQAAVFAKGQAYGRVPPCTESLRNFWVIWRDDRMFAQYQPGWPLFMVPFVWARAVWMAGPVSLGLLVVSASRVCRMVVRDATADEAAAVNGGRIAAGLLVLSNTLLVNGGSRFPHVFVCALWCIAIEQAASLVRAKTPRDGLRAALLLGGAAGWLVTTRVPEGLLTSALVVMVLVGLVRRRVRLAHVLAAGAVAAAWMVVFLGISRLQTGVWLKLPYSVATEFYPWNHYSYSLPEPHLAKWHVPLATGAYSWWPVAPAIGLAGCILALRTPARWLVAVIGGGALVTLLYYFCLEVGRGTDFGYGPRYQMITVVPSAIGAALVLHRAGVTRRGPRLFAAWAVFAGGAALIAIYTFPYTHGMLKDGMAIEKAAARHRLANAIVLVPQGTHRYGDYDVTRNLPIELYDPPVIYANERDVACLRAHFSGRTLYRVTNRTSPGFTRP